MLTVKFVKERFHHHHGEERTCDIYALQNITEMDKYLRKLNDDRVEERKWMAALNVVPM